MNKIKLIALDLDGTLLDDTHNISEYTIQVWKKVKQEGIHIMPVTGRPLMAMLDRVIPRGLCEYTINANGIHIFKIHDTQEELIWDKSMPWDVTKKVIDFFNEKYPHAYLQMYIGQEIYALELNEKSDEYSSRTSLTYNVLQSWDEIKDKEIVKIMALGNNDDLLPISHDLSTWDSINAVFSNPKYLEIFNAVSSKGKAILFVANQLGIHASEILGLGDAINDVSMLEVCGHAYVMKNGDKEVAPHLPRTDFTNNEDGAAKQIEKLLGWQ